MKCREVINRMLAKIDCLRLYEDKKRQRTKGIGAFGSNMDGNDDKSSREKGLSNTLDSSPL
jgi:hypothetical protein